MSNQIEYHHPIRLKAFIVVKRKKLLALKHQFNSEKVELSQGNISI